ncbi:hypothetical protein [uncultured Victivallis sp.]|nr:hypothetical protein [uncultured Victivallis sp.]
MKQHGIPVLMIHGDELRRLALRAGESPGRLSLSQTPTGAE